MFALNYEYWSVDKKWRSLILSHSSQCVYHRDVEGMHCIPFHLLFEVSQWRQTLWCQIFESICNKFSIFCFCVLGKFSKLQNCTFCENMASWNICSYCDIHWSYFHYWVLKIDKFGPLLCIWWSRHKGQNFKWCPYEKKNCLIFSRAGDKSFS